MQDNDDLKRAIESPNEVIHEVNNQMAWLIDNVDTVDAITLAEKLQHVWAGFAEVDEDRVRHLAIAHRVVAQLDGKLTHARKRNDEFMLSNDELVRALESERMNARDHEKAKARLVSLEMDMEVADAATVLDMLTGELDVYVSIYTKMDIVQVLREALDEVEQSREDMDADGGVAD